MGEKPVTMGTRRASDASSRADAASPARLRYGFCGWSPDALQGLCRPLWVLVVMCLCNVFQSMTINGLIGVILTSLEVRFDLSSSSR